MRYTDEWILDAIQAVVADGTPDPGVGVVALHREPFERLKTVLGQARKNNEQARDLKRLVKQALETQDAANPRPLSTIFANLVHTVMADQGNPGYENSAAVRLLLHQLLHLLDKTGLPLYSRDLWAYERDTQACEEQIGIREAA